MTYSKQTYCKCRVKKIYRSMSLDNKVMCEVCLRPLHQNYGRPQNAAQRLAGQRNWDHAQLRGIEGRLQHYISQYGTSGSESELTNLIQDLRYRIDNRWQNAKEKLQK